MTETTTKKTYKATTEELLKSRRSDKKQVFKLDSSAYSRAQKQSRTEIRTAELAAQRAQDEPDDLIPPDVMRYLTIELPVEQILSGVEQRIAEARTIVSDKPVELGGHMTQTIQLPVIGSDELRAADTDFGMYLEFVEPGDDDSVRSEMGMMFPKTVYRNPAKEAEQKSVTAPPEEFGERLTGAVSAPDADNERILFLEKSKKLRENQTRSREHPVRRALRIALIVLCSLIIAGILGVMVLQLMRFKLVSIFDDGVFSTTILTRDIGGDLERDGVVREIEPEDAVSYTDDEGFLVRVDVQRSWPVSIRCDGATTEIVSLDNTVAELLSKAGIVLGADDTVTPALDTVPAADDQIFVSRVTYMEREVTEVIPSRNVEKRSPLIADGRTQVMNPGGGRDGEALRVYRDKYVDGELAESTLLSETVSVFPYDVVTLVGDSTAIMSSLNGSDFSDIQIVNNAPATYERVLERGTCTAYSFKPGVYGASGMHLIQGFVAVNTDVIPYGSLLYITSPDGSFVYGWAIAADVGEAMMDGYVDIDCFFETYTESALFGKKYLNVYVVKQLTQSELQRYAANPYMFERRIPAA